MTIKQGSKTSLGEPAPDPEAQSRAPAGKDRIQTSAEASQSSTNHAQTRTKPKTPIATELSDDDLPIESTGYFLSTGWIARHSLQSIDSGQIRNTTSTSGTSVYIPPLVVEASPRSKKLKSDGSTSSSTSSDGRDPNLL